MTFTLIGWYIKRSAIAILMSDLFAMIVVSWGDIAMNRGAPKTTYY
jgi:hypothetical protein